MFDNLPMKWTGTDFALQQKRSRQLRHSQTGNRHQHQGEEGNIPRILQTTTRTIVGRNGVQRRVGNNRKCFYGRLGGPEIK